MIKRQEAEGQEAIAFQETSINAKGYGRVAKQVMADSSLTMNEKGLYCYICAMSGSGDNTYTSRAKVLMDLGIARTTYDRCMDGLEEKNIIARYQKRRKGKFGVTVIGLVEVPKCYAKEIHESPDVELADYGSVYGLGWGMIPRMVMQDTSLPLKARALYGYIRAYAGMNGSTNPNRERVMRELNITQNTYDKYKRNLIDTGYISISQTYQNGRFQSGCIRINKYPNMMQENDPLLIIQTEAGTKIINAPKEKKQSVPVCEEAKKKQHLKNRATVKSPKNCSSDQYLKNRATVKTVGITEDFDTELAEEEKQHLKNRATVQHLKKQSTVSDATDSILNNTINTLTIMIDRLIADAKKFFSYEILSFSFNDNPVAVDCLDRIMEIYAKVQLCEKPMLMIAGQPMLTQSIKRDLENLTSNGVQNVVARYLTYYDPATIKNPDAYLLTSLWHEAIAPAHYDEGEEIT